eukprot:17284-Heterococcus_DN1.PRE.2
MKHTIHNASADSTAVVTVLVPYWLLLSSLPFRCQQCQHYYCSAVAVQQCRHSAAAAAAGAA